MSEKRTCGNCGCYEEYKPNAVTGDKIDNEGRCFARPPVREKPDRAGYVSGHVNWDHPPVAKKDHCVHDWVPKGLRDLPATEDDIIKEPAPFSGVKACPPDFSHLTGHARHALAQAGIVSAQELSTFTEEDAGALGGVGPAVMAEFKQLLETNGLAFMEPGAVAEVPKP